MGGEKEKWMRDFSVIVDERWRQSEEGCGCRIGCFMVGFELEFLTVSVLFMFSCTRQVTFKPLFEVASSNRVA